MENFSLTTQAINHSALRAQFENPHCGAFVCFEGWVRNHHQKKNVTALFYQAYAQLALYEGEKIIAAAVKNFAIASACCQHRVGHLTIGEMAVWVGVNAAHRDAAFDACRFIIDQIKKDVPIWKKESYVEDANPTQWIHPHTL